MQTLTKAQKKIIYIVLAGAAVLICFLIFVYFPESRALRAAQAKLTAVENQIAEVHALLQGNPLPEALKDLNLAFAKEAALFPSREEDVLKFLSETETRLAIEVKDRSLLPAEIMTDKVPGFIIKKIPVTMRLVCQYKALGEYLYVLRNNPSVLVRLKRVELTGHGQGQVKLDADIAIEVYLAEKSG